MEISHLLRKAVSLAESVSPQQEQPSVTEVCRVVELLEAGEYVRPIELALACCIVRNWLVVPIERNESAEDERRVILSLARPVFKAMIPDDGCLIAIPRQSPAPAPL